MLKEEEEFGIKDLKLIKNLQKKFIKLEKMLLKI